MAELIPNFFKEGHGSRGQNGGPQILEISWQAVIPTTTLGATPLDLPLGVPRRANVTLVAGNGASVNVTIYDENSYAHAYTILANNPFLAKKAIVTRIVFSGSGGIITGVLSWPEEVDPASIAVIPANQPSVLTEGGIVSELTVLNGLVDLPPTLTTPTTTLYNATQSGTLLYSIGMDRATSGTTPANCSLWISVKNGGGTIVHTVAVCPAGPEFMTGRLWIPSGYSITVGAVNADSVAHVASISMQVLASVTP